MKAVNISLLVLGLLALLETLFPDLAFTAAITIIGLPIAVALVLAPGLFPIVAIVWLAYRLFGLHRTPFGGVIALPIALSILAIPALILNPVLGARVDAFLADDHDDLKLPLKARTIAVRKKQDVDGIHLSCGGFCLHALLTGAAERIILLNEEDSSSSPDPESRGRSFHIERRSKCPAVTFYPGEQRLNLDLPPDRIASKYASPVVLMKLRIEQGECLIESEAPLADADVVLSTGLIHAGLSNSDAGIDPFADTVTAYRNTVDQRTKNGFEEVYRLTGVRAGRLAPILFAVPHFAEERRGTVFMTAFLRRTRYFNLPGYNSGLDWPAFLTKTLKLDLALDDTGIRKMQRQRTEAVLAAHRAPTKEEWADFATYANSLVRSEPEDADVAVVLDVLERPDFPVPNLFESLGQKIAHSNDTTLQKRYADALFRRLDAGQTWAEGTGDLFPAKLSTLGLAIGQLPASAVEGHFDNFVSLAGDGQRREGAWHAFKAMRYFGDKAVPVYIKLIEAGIDDRRNSSRNNHYEYSYRAGLEGLCLMGAEGASALPRLEQLQAEGKLVRYDRYRRLLANTFVRFGADSKSLLALYADGRDNDRILFDQDVARARSAKPACGY